MRRIVLLLQSGVGDVIMAIPLLRACGSNLQIGDKLLILVDSMPLKNIVENAISVDDRINTVCIGEAWSSAKFSVLRLAYQLRRFRPTLFLAPQSTNRLRITLFSAIVGAGTTILPHSAPNSLLFGRSVNSCREHKVKYYLRFGALGGLNTDTSFSMKLNVPEYHLTEAKKLLVDWDISQKWIGFAPGSGIIEAHKRWPISYYQSLGKALLQKGSEFRIAIFGSPSEIELVNEIRKSITTRTTRVVSIVVSDIMIVSAAVSHCKCLVSACSGLSHVAAAVGTPVVGLYGPTNPGFTGPFSNKVRIVRAGIKCSPCYRVGFIEGCGNPVCMSMIEPHDVEKEVILALNGEFVADIPWHPTTNADNPDI